MPTVPLRCRNDLPAHEARHGVGKFIKCMHDEQRAYKNTTIVNTEALNEDHLFEGDSLNAKGTSLLVRLIKQNIY
jgi:hypothetical protein